LANNHIHDYGHQGVIHTLESLEKYGLLQVGLNSQNGKLKNFIKQKIKNMNIGIAAFTSDEPWIKSKLNDDPHNLVFYSRTNVGRIIGNLRESCDFVIIIMHWGFEKHEYPSPLQVDIAKYCIDEGADVVVGHHSHVVQGYRIYKNRPIFFSLGHLFFSDFYYKTGGLYKWKEKNRYGLSVELTLRKKNDLSFKLIPIFQGQDFQVEELKANAREEFLKHLEKISGKMDLLPQKYSRFWRGHHFSVRRTQLFANMKSTFKSSNPMGMRRFIRMGKLFLLIVNELVKWLLAIKPEKGSRYV
jgi:poly-gamma-glutamate synthesis protein (capsule biosynthesis protein)